MKRKGRKPKKKKEKSFKYNGRNFSSPLEMTYPPRAMTINMAKDPKVLATIIFRPKDPIKRKRARDIWCRKKNNRNCSKNLQIGN